MNAVLFGASGMVGQGVLRECLLDPDVEKILSIARTPTNRRDAKLRELTIPDFTNFSAIESELTGFDACFFCLGVSSAGMTEARYRGITYGFTIAAAQTLSKLNPGMTFVYVSGQGANRNGRAMWARVKGETENALLRLPFKAAYMLRPGAVQPLHGIRSKTRAYQVVYSAIGPFFPILHALFPKYVTTTEQLGLAAIKLAKAGYARTVLENAAINSI